MHMLLRDQTFGSENICAVNFDIKKEKLIVQFFFFFFHCYFDNYVHIVIQRSTMFTTAQREQ